MCGALKWAASAAAESHSSKTWKTPSSSTSAEKVYEMQPASRRVSSMSPRAAAMASARFAGSREIRPAITSMGHSTVRGCGILRRAAPPGQGEREVGLGVGLNPAPGSSDEPAMRRVLRMLVALLALAPAPALADAVVPIAAVRTRVIVRERPEAASRDLGSLRPRERAEYLGAAPGWRRVRLADGTTGFVSEAFTEVLALAASAEAEPVARPPASLWRRLGSALGIA